jgi:acyl-CoA reductase-like NAD-dependent aldehyde dehydrogenase
MQTLFKTYSPIDNSVYVERHFATQEIIQQTLLKAQKAAIAWRITSLAERKTRCTQAVNALVANKETLAEEICWQMGRPIRYAAGEINGLEERARYMIAHAETALTPLTLPEKPGFIRYIKHEPLSSPLGTEVFQSHQSIPPHIPYHFLKVPCDQVKKNQDVLSAYLPPT